MDDVLGSAHGHSDAKRTIANSHTAAECGWASVYDRWELNDFLRNVNAGGGINGELLPLVSDDAKFNDSFNSFDIRISRVFVAGPTRIEAIAEVFNLFNVTNILGTTTVNYSGYANALARDSSDPANAGFLRSSRFGTPVSTAGGVFGSGGPRALQLAARVRF